MRLFLFVRIDEGNTRLTKKIWSLYLYPFKSYEQNKTGKSDDIFTVFQKKQNWPFLLFFYVQTNKDTYLFLDKAKTFTWVDDETVTLLHMHNYHEVCCLLRNVNFHKKWGCQKTLKWLNTFSPISQKVNAISTWNKFQSS